MTTADVDLAKFLTQERHAVHLIGVAGSGMSGIAGLLLQLGHNVSGSDKLVCTKQADYDEATCELCLSQATVFIRK